MYVYMYMQKSIFMKENFSQVYEKKIQINTFKKSQKKT